MSKCCLCQLERDKDKKLSEQAYAYSSNSDFWVCVECNEKVKEHGRIKRWLFEGDPSEGTITEKIKRLIILRRP